MDEKKEVYIYTPYRAPMIWFMLILQRWSMKIKMYQKKVQINPTFLAVSFVYLGILSPFIFLLLADGIKN